MWLRSRDREWCLSKPSLKECVRTVAHYNEVLCMVYVVPFQSQVQALNRPPKMLAMVRTL